MYGSYIRPMFRRMKAVSSTCASTSGSVANSTLGSTTYGANFDVTIMCTTGTIWINGSTTATTNSFQLNEGDSIDMKVKDILYTIADTTTAKFQAIIWE